MYNLPSDSIGKVQRWMNAKKAAGILVQPWELEKAWEGEFNALGQKEDQARRLALGEAGLAEKVRMNNIQADLAKEQMASSERAGQFQLGGQALGAALLYPYLKKRQGTV